MSFMPDWFDTIENEYQGEEAICETIPASKQGVSSQITLNGEWKFKFCDMVAYVPEGFEAKDYDDGRWEGIDVPSCWQVKGYGKKHYTNDRFPFPVDLPYVPNESNVGCYRRVFALPREMLEKRIYLVCEGICSAFFIWINGKKLGFGQGSHNCHKYDVTDFVKEGENVIAVEVYQYSIASYIENQDMWRMNGIFRDIYLYSQEKYGLTDITLNTDFTDDYKNGVLKCDMEFAGICDGADVEVSLLYNGSIEYCEEKKLSEKLSYECCIANVHKWTAETPALYDVIIKIKENGNVKEVYSYKTGFRKIEIQDSMLLVNGKQIKIKGVNHHDFSTDTGYTLSKADLEKDIILMKKNNFNTVRCSHYPPCGYLLELCDEYGLYVIDEADFECSGFSRVGNRNWIVNDPMWKKLYVDRVKKMVCRDKNHPSVIIWSIGNESASGQNNQEMTAWIRSYDISRPLHYEPAQEEQYVEINSRMYATHKECEEIGMRKYDKRPMILCEYVHSMGNGPGGVQEYFDLFYKYDRLIGGCIWEWTDHGIREENEKGDQVFKYGGDYGEWPNDGNYCCDGLCFPDRKPHVGLVHVKNIMSPITVEYENGKIILTNRYDFLSTEDIDIFWSLIEDGNEIENGKLNIVIAPHESAEIEPPYSFVGNGGQYCLNLYFKTNKESSWCDAGYSLGHKQIVLTQYSKKCVHTKDGDLGLQESKHEIKVIGKGFEAVISKIYGKLISFKKSGKEYIKDGPELCVTRAVTDNDVGLSVRFADMWDTCGLNQLKHYVRDAEVTDIEDGKVTISVNARLATPFMIPIYLVQYIYTVFANGEINLKVRAKYQIPYLKYDLTCLPRIGLTMQLSKGLENVSWYGMGPMESYPDKKAAAMIGRYSMNVDDLFENHIRPQENGNRSDVRWLKFNDKKGNELTITSDEIFNFTARHYTDQNMNDAKHTDELEKIKEVALHIDHLITGVGTASCGPETLEKYCVMPRDYEFDINIK